MNEFWNAIGRALGLGTRPEQLVFSQLALRAVIIFLVALVLMRAGHKRSLARKTAFDTAFVIIIGAVLARAINGSGPFFPTIGISILLVFLHRALGFIAYRSPGFERLIKGRPELLLREGELLREPLRHHDISHADLEEDLHLCGKHNLGEIALARLERSGDISFIPKQPNEKS
jgi:uncharacterized membrane protein YcaP (DUF421 family)